MNRGEKIIPGFTMIGLRYDNSSAMDLIVEEQLVDDLLILSPDHTVTIQDIWKLRSIKESLPYHDGDFKMVEVLPYRDHDVDYTRIVFDLAGNLADKDRKSPDGESILMQMWDARALAQTGVLFGIIPPEPTKIPGFPSNEPVKEVSSIEDTIQIYNFTEIVGPVIHEPDLPVTLYVYGSVPTNGNGIHKEISRDDVIQIG